MQTKDVAAIWRVTPQAVGLWHSKKKCPRNPDGTYNLPAVIAWREAQAEGHASFSRDIAAEQCREVAARADLRQLEVAKALEITLVKNDVLAIICEVISGCKTRLLGVAPDVAPDVADMDNPEEIQSYISKQIKEALNALSSIGEKLGGLNTAEKSSGTSKKPRRSPKKNPGGVASTAKSNSKPVGRPRKTTVGRKRRKNRPVDDKQS